MEQAATARLMRRLNRSAILNLIRTEGPMARSRIAHRLNMSLPTVMRSVDELIEEDLVRFEGSEPSGGRRRPLLEFNGAAYAVIGVDLGGTTLSGAVTDLSGHILHERSIPTPPRSGPAQALDDLYRLIDDLRQAPRPASQPIRGIGVGVPGVTLADSGVVVWSPALGWRDLPLQERLAARYNLPVFVENDVNLAALGEYGFGVASGVSNLVCVAIGTGIGAGILLEGKLYRGHHQAAGEVGYFLPGVEYLGQRHNEFGALEQLASGSGIAARARQIRQEENGGLSVGGASAEDVFEMARQGMAWARRIVSETVNYLSLMIAGISALLDPEVVVLSGGVARSADLLIEPIKQQLEGVVPYVPHIVASNLGSRAVVMGSVMLVLDGTTGHVMVRQRI